MSTRLTCRVMATALGISIVAGCAATGGSERPGGPPPWSASELLPEMSLRLEARYIYVPRSSSVSQIDKIADAGDINHDGFSDLRIIYLETVGVTRDVVVLSGKTLASGDLSRLSRAKRLVSRRDEFGPAWPSALVRYRTSRLGDLDGDGRPERAVMRTSHQTTHYPCGETRCTDNY